MDGASAPDPAPDAGSPCGATPSARLVASAGRRLATSSMHAVVLLASILGGGPSHAQDAAAPVGANALPSVALPPDLERVLRDYERAWRAEDVEALAALFAEDGFVLQSERPPARGRASIRAAYEGQAGGPLRLRALAFAAGDTTACIIGGYAYGTRPGDIGKFTLTLRRAPGGPWLIYSDMDNLNAAPKRRAGPGAPASSAVPPGP